MIWVYLVMADILTACVSNRTYNACSNSRQYLQGINRARGGGVLIEGGGKSEIGNSEIGRRWARQGMVQWGGVK